MEITIIIIAIMIIIKAVISIIIILKIAIIITIIACNNYKNSNNNSNNSSNNSKTSNNNYNNSSNNYNNSSNNDNNYNNNYPCNCVSLCCCAVLVTWSYLCVSTGCLWVIMYKCWWAGLIKVILRTCCGRWGRGVFWEQGARDQRRVAHELLT